MSTTTTVLLVGGVGLAVYFMTRPPVPPNPYQYGYPYVNGVPSPLGGQVNQSFTLGSLVDRLAGPLLNGLGF